MKSMKGDLAAVRDSGVAAVPRTGRPIEIEYPPHVVYFLTLLQTHFASPAGAREWDDHDARNYGRQVLPLSGPQTREIFDLLQERHIFRPAVQEVTKAVADLGLNRGTEWLPGHALESRRDSRQIRAETQAKIDERRSNRVNGMLVISGTGESDARQSFREAVRNLPGFRDSGARTLTEKFNERSAVSAT